MSDIGLPPGLGWLLTVFFALMMVGPPLIFGLVFLLGHVFISKRGLIWATLYFVTSVVTIIVAMWWCADWFNLPEMFYWSLPAALGSSVGVFGIFLWVRSLVRVRRNDEPKKNS